VNTTPTPRRRYLLATWLSGGSLLIVFVALDAEAGKPTAVPSWTPSDDEDRQLSEYATQVMALSKGIEEAVARYRDAEIRKAAG